LIQARPPLRCGRCVFSEDERRRGAKSRRGLGMDRMFIELMGGSYGPGAEIGQREFDQLSMTGG
jgi:hypothetical protein